MCFKRRSVILLIILVLLCVICVESKAKKWRAHIKKKSKSPKISATFRTVPSKHKIIHKHKSAPHKRNSKMNYYHPLPSSWPTHNLPAPTYYLASNYPRYRSYITTSTKTPTLRKFDLTTPFISGSTFPFGTLHSPLRRADEFNIASGSSTLPSTSLVDMNAFDAAIADGVYAPELPINREFIQPEMSLGGWTPIDYKSFMADGDFSLLNDQMGQLSGDGRIFSNQFEPHFLV